MSLEPYNIGTLNTSNRITVVFYTEVVFMAMKVMYNAGAQMSLRELNANTSNASKALTKVSSGEKFSGASNDPASYTISERMREQIRSLFQDDQNVQNGSAMIRTAERGIDQIISNLRTMKEKAINAANDSNTDDDRRTIQKEIDQCRHVIDDIAIGTQYNGKILLDGRWTHGGLQSPKRGGGGANTTVENVVGGFKAGRNAIEVSAEQSGGYGIWQLDTDKQFSGGNFSVELDFSEMSFTNGNSFPEALHSQGFTILCRACPQYINVLFDSNKTAGQSTYNPTAGVAEDGTINPYAREFVIGVKTVKSAEDLAQAIYDGMSTTRGQKANGIPVDSKHSLTMYRDSSGKIFLSKNGSDMQFKEGTIPNPLTDPIEPVETEEKNQDRFGFNSVRRQGNTPMFILRTCASKLWALIELKSSLKTKQMTQ